ncbi:hypothetical protein BY458DRAFT_506858 [Sporodiniella umbellata]|nr:hypothetical protein BY458DRAFT_506858 [Sporodiniella umbellata]
MTLTPLHTTSTPITRIMTCYCGDACLCPGCFVHPDNHLKLVELPFSLPVLQQDYLFI